MAGLEGVFRGDTELSDAIKIYEADVIPRGQEEVKCSVENGYMLHDWKKVEASPVFTRGFKPMEGHDSEPKEQENLGEKLKEAEETKMAISTEV
ncbi:hypothetical protein NW767_000235 [Fusarium falciforme]|nr:hypothetical protein NW767_000235 [Fusarium falciforme]